MNWGQGIHEEEVHIEQFAEQHRVRVTKDECGDPIIRGRVDESNIYEYCPTELGVAFLTSAKKSPRTLLWNKFQSACLGAGMTLRQQGDAEGCFSFDPTNETQAKIALKGIRVRFKKQLSPEHRAALAHTAFKRKSHALEGSVSR